MAALNEPVHIDAGQMNMIGIQENFSSVLYLTDHGGTRFYSPNHTSQEHEYFEKSEVGKLIFFPSTLLHDGNNFDVGERIIISSNIAIGNL